MSTRFKHEVALDELISDLCENHRAVSEETLFTVHTLVLPKSVVSYGEASFGRCPDSALYEFEIGLGPANAKRLIEFLFTLPPEPDHELEPTNGDSP